MNGRANGMTIYPPSPGFSRAIRRRLPKLIPRKRPRLVKGRASLGGRTRAAELGKDGNPSERSVCDDLFIEPNFPEVKHQREKVLATALNPTLSVGA